MGSLKQELLGLLKENDLRPSRALGQNFLVDQNAAKRIARLSAAGPQDQVVEIGAGLGSLTLALAGTGARVTALEIDRHLVPLLEERVRPAGVEVVCADAMEVDWERLTSGGGRWLVVGNLPYNIATGLVMRVIESASAVGRILVMVQSEVAERLVAKPGDAARGAVSVRLSYWATASTLARFPPDVFLPRPKVSSSLVLIERLPVPLVDVEYARLCGVVRAGFAQRRKMLRRSLGAILSEEEITAAGVRPEARAEELDLESWARLTRCTYESALRPS